MQNIVNFNERIKELYPTADYIDEDHLRNNEETISIFRCPHCKGIFGIDVTWWDQVYNKEFLDCIMCKKKFMLETF